MILVVVGIEVRVLLVMCVLVMLRCVSLCR